MVDKDERIIFKKMAEALDRSSGSVSNILGEKLRFSIFWRKKTGGLGLPTQNLSSESMTIVTQGVSMMSLLVIKHMNLKKK